MSLASRGLRDLGSGLERLSSADTRAVRAQARQVHRRALIATLAYTAVVLLLP